MVLRMATIGARIARLRTAKGWSLSRLGEEMASRIGRAKPFSGELLRLYEADKHRPGKAARKALALVFDRSETYIEFGDQKAATTPTEAEAFYSRYLALQQHDRAIVDLLFSKPVAKPGKEKSSAKAKHLSQKGHQ